MGTEKLLMLKNTESSLGPTGSKAGRKPGICLHFMSASFTLAEGKEVSHFHS